MARAIFILAAAAVTLTGCIDLTPVGNFAKESSTLAGATTLDASDALVEVRTAAKSAGLDPDQGAYPVPDPVSSSFKQQQAVTAAASKALSAYMAKLAELSSKSTTSMGADISSISTSLGSLHVADAHAQAALSASQSLANLLTGAAVKYTTRTLILAAAKPVDEITLYLADQAKVLSDDYRNADNLSQDAWSRLRASAGPDVKNCQGSNLCPLVYRLAYRAAADDSVTLRTKAASALQAEVAFEKVRKDHQTLVDNVDHLTAEQVVDELRADEPYIQTAITDLRRA